MKYMCFARHYFLMSVWYNQGEVYRDHGNKWDKWLEQSKAGKDYDSERFPLNNSESMNIVS